MAFFFRRSFVTFFLFLLDEAAITSTHNLCLEQKLEK